jgi:glucose-6-phosphate isomerase/transaldolase/glucose-6-phosphate isomerase
MTTNSDGEATIPPDVAQSLSDCLAELDAQRFTERIQVHDATLWRGNEDESRKRLGWLHVNDTMGPQTGSMVSFADRARGDGFVDVVLLGMGGSSLGAEVLSQVIGGTPGFPRLHVLDSTVPGAVAFVSHRINLEHTLFIVSSKSGGTLEPNLLYEYFSHNASATAGHEAGSQFIAITDAGSSLERTARQHGFRHTFLNPTDIGGRYSVLSLFGLVPAALLGIDISRLLSRAAHMAGLCARGTHAKDNPGAYLGSYIGGCARLGRNKLTFLTSPRLQSFGLWAEQLIAESTGKEGKGVVPVMGEPELPLSAYSYDRAFVYLRLRGDENAATDRLAERLAGAGFPCLTFDAADEYALGSEFYRWEYATAVLGTLLGINPFDQPDVQRAKDASTKMLQHYEAHGSLPHADGTVTLPALLDSLRQGDYLGVTAYIRQRPETDSVFSRFRQRIGSQYRVCTTVGYGPRFLHSTGQLHKGGPNECVLLQIVSEYPDDVPVPGKDFSFGTVADAQALGDLQALLSLNRRVGRIVLESDDPALLATMLESG